MSAAEKFMFDVAFDDEPAIHQEPEVKEELPVVEEEIVEEIIPTFSEEEVEQARMEGFEAGKLEGLEATSEALTKQINQSLNQIDQQLAVTLQKQDAENNEMSRAALSVALGVCRKILPTLAEKHAFGEIERVLESVFIKIIEEPRVTMNVHPDVAGKIEKRISELATSKGYEGNISVRAETSLAPGDCKVEWSNGGSERDSQALWRDIDKIIGRYIGNAPTAWDMPDVPEGVVEESQPDILEPESLVDTGEPMNDSESADLQELPEEMAGEAAKNIVEDVLSDVLGVDEPNPDTDTDA